MIRIFRCTLALALAVTMPLSALAEQHQSQSRPAPPPSRPAPPPSRPAPAYHPAPAYRPAPPPRTNPGGFNLPHDINPPPAMHQIPGRTQPVPAHPIAPPPTRPITRPIPPQQRPMPPGAHPQPPRGPYPSGPYHNWHGPVVNNPHHWNNWGWNRGVVWYPAPIYWGWGFWGPWVVGANLVLFGSIADYSDQQIYPSYQIQPSSPGAQMLQDYGLTQTECGPPNLVVIWGPDNSVICAYPNDLVSAGNYELDPTTLTIQSLGTSPNPSNPGNP